MTSSAIAVFPSSKNSIGLPIPDESVLHIGDCGVHLDRYELRALELGINDHPPQPLEQVAGCGLTAARSGRDLRELTEDPRRFQLFAFVSSLFCPDAGKQFRLLRRHQEFRTKHNQRTGRELKHGCIGKEKYATDAQLEQRAERIAQAAEDLWWFPNATADSISPARPPFNPPHWVGDSPLSCVEIVPCVSHAVTADDFTRLVKKFGYDPLAAWTSIVHAKLQPPPDRRRRVVCPNLSAQEGDDLQERNSAGFAQPLPYVAAPARHTKQGCEFTRRQVAEAVDKMRIDALARRAVTKIVYARLPLKVVAKAYSIKWQTLKTYAQRVRLRLRTNRQ